MKTKDHTSIPSKSRSVSSEKRSNGSNNVNKPAAADHSNNEPIEKFDDVEDQPTLETSSTKLTDTSNSLSPNNKEDDEVEDAADQRTETVSSTIPNLEEQQRRINLLLDDMSNDAPDHAFSSASTNSIGNDRDEVRPCRADPR